MDSGLTKTIGLAAITVLITVFVARASGAPAQEAGGTLADSVAAKKDSGVTPKWIDDPGVLALIGVMNGREMAAANLELSGWHSDTVRALAAQMARDHGELQRSTDSVAALMKMTPVAPALAENVTIAFQAQMDSMVAGRGGMALDRGYVAQQIASHAMMASYIDQISAVADRPELQAWLDVLGGRVDAQIARAKAVQAQLAARDSIVADSVARRDSLRAARAARRNQINR